MQNFLFKNIIIPAHFNYKKSNRINLYNKLSKRDFLTLEELKEIQWSKLKSLINHCYHNVPYYKNLFDENNIHPEDIKNLKDYSKIPKLKKSNIRENLDELINSKVSKNELIFDSTSGSTGIPLRLARNDADFDYGCAIKLRSNAWGGWKYWEKSAWFVTDLRHITQINSLKGRLSLMLSKKLLLDTQSVQREDMFRWADQVKSFKPKHIYGYSSLLGEFSKFVLENNINIEGVKGVYSTAEPLRMRTAISKTFNAPVYDQYGASEIPCIAHECKNGNMHLNIDEVLVEFEDTNKNSEIKRMVCTPLYVYSMPLLRYDIGDTALPVLKKCDCDLPYPVIELKVGRLSDNLLSPNGKLVSGISLSWYMVDIPQDIRQYQIIQENIRDFTVKLVGEEKSRAYNEINITNLLRKMLDTQEIKIKFEHVNEILPGANGKYRPIMSKTV